MSGASLGQQVSEGGPRDAATVGQEPGLPAEARKPFRILVTGSRSWPDLMAVWDAIHAAAVQAMRAGHSEFVVVHGACPKGADAHAAAFCQDQARWYGSNGRVLADEPHPADWNGPAKRGAGFARNADMVRLGADVVLAFIVDGSRGATHTADLAEKAGIPVRRYERNSRA